MEANFFSILTFGTPVLAAPVALIFGLRKALLICLVVGCLLLIGPYVYFGIRALIEGVGLWGTLRAVSVTTPAIALIVGYILVWTAAYGAIAAGVRLGWLYWRRTRT